MLDSNLMAILVKAEFIVVDEASRQFSINKRHRLQQELP
jgi:hypothetical protein